MRARAICAPVLLLLGAVPAALAQQWEFGAGAAGSFYTTRTVTGPRDSAEGGLARGWGAAAVLGHNMYKRWGGEIRYLFGRNDLELSSGSTRANFRAQSHTVTYEVLYYATDNPEARVKPYLAAGGGAKIYQGTGVERAFQPLSDVALLTKANDIQPVISFGGGVKCALTSNIGIRIDFRDHLTRFPKKVITPNIGSKVEGWIHNWLPMVSLMFMF
jgi:opacity protein-like surface antigen